MVDLNMDNPYWSSLRVLEEIRLRDKISPETMVKWIGQEMDQPTEAYIAEDVAAVMHIANVLMAPIPAEDNLDQWLAKHQDQKETLGMADVISIMHAGVEDAHLQPF
jgi:hypothetical protein